MNKKDCGHCGHASHNGHGCTEILTSERLGKMQYGPGDIGNECGCEVNQPGVVDGLSNVMVKGSTVI